MPAGTCCGGIESRNQNGTAEANVPTVRTDSKDDEELTVHATELIPDR